MSSEILQVAQAYCDTFGSGDYRTAANHIDPQDRVDFQRELLAALSVLERAGFDCGLKEKFENRSVEELSTYSAEDFLALFLSQAIGKVEGLEMKILSYRMVDDSRAVVEYQVASMKNDLEMRLAPYGWKVRLRQGLTVFADRVRDLALDFLQRAEKDRVVPPEAPLEPYALYGYKDEAGDTVIEPRFEKAEEFSDGLAAVRVMGRWGYIDHTGKLRIPVRYLGATSFQDERAFICELDVNFTKVWAMIDKRGEHLTDFIFREAHCFSEGLAAARLKKAWGYVDTSGGWAIKPQFSEVSAFEHGEAWVTHPRHGSYVIDRQGCKIAE